VIFVTVGGQLPFDRLIRSVDAWAGARQQPDVFAQIGSSSFRPRHIRWSEFLDPDEFRRVVQSSDGLVAHAGMGSIITALEFGKPILVMPRRADLRETRSDHQVDTAKHLREQGYVDVAFDENELSAHLDALVSAEGRAPIATTASGELVRVLRSFIEES
jgi:UDP-N-acetylglucosamine transferase subunit ALG13